MTIRSNVVLIAAALLAAGAVHPLRGQAAAPDSAGALAAVQACEGAAQAQQEDASREAADRAERLLTAWRTASPASARPLVAQARVKSMCRIPFAEMMAKGQLLMESNALLEQALALEPTSWETRFRLAMNHFHSPPFMGRTGEAVRHLETLLAQQGDRADVPSFAGTYLYLGDLYKRTGREDDARRTWEKGHRLFPQNPSLAARLGATPAAAASAPATGTAPPSAPPAVKAPVRLDAITVQAGVNRMDDAHSGTALRRVEVLTTPGGTADVLQAFQTAPGTSRAGEGSDLYVRGGDPAETPVFVNGARLFYPGRYESVNGGVFGILDSNVIATAAFSSGGFSARWGDALSGVVDVETTGRPQTRTVRVNANTVEAAAVVDLPLGADAGAWASLRAQDSRLLLAMHGRGGDFATAPHALAGTAGFTWRPDSRREVRVTALSDTDGSGKTVDAYGYQGEFGLHGRNQLLSVSGRLLSVDGRTGLRGSLSGSTRESGYRFGVLDRTRTDRGLAARVDGDAMAGGATRVRTGLEARWMDGREEGTVPTTDQLGPGSPARALDGATAATSHLGGYVETETAIAGRVAIVAGVRGDRLPGETAWTADPRIALAVAADAWTFRVGGGVFHQGRSRIRWQVPAAGDPAGTPRVAEHLVAGAERTGEPSLKVEAYAKRYGGYVAAGDGPAITAGSARGVDAIAKWTHQKRLNGWLTYSYLHGRVSLADGRTVPSSVDVTHSLTAVGRFAVTDVWELGVTARYGTGRPFTPVAGTAPGASPGAADVAVWGTPNGERMPDYRRLDARLSRYLPMKAGLGIVYLELLNALDTRNVAAYSYDAGYRNRRAVDSFFAHRTAVLGFGVPL
jgi:vitamin B12 transporter